MVGPGQTHNFTPIGSISQIHPRWSPEAVHGLVIDRAFSGASMGERLLRWALRRSAEEGAQYLRLDCVETNVRLRRYYLDAGFVEVGRRDFGDDADNGWFSVVLFERTPT
ncbi:GNAT family N-acetyltransferase [Rhodococcus sp. IEGM 1409]|uniref:GNAT family N-acetyltransferase n=1 Tax=Rhodococcus sp. IEGM 1409 TaxID=3047082 RepID=UPI0032D59E25